MRAGRIRLYGFILCTLGLLASLFNLFIAIASFWYTDRSYFINFILAAGNLLQILYYTLALTRAGKFLGSNTGSKLIPGYFSLLLEPFLSLGIVIKDDRLLPKNLFTITAIFVRVIAWLFNWIMFIAFVNAREAYSKAAFAAPYDLYDDWKVGVDGGVPNMLLSPIPYKEKTNFVDNYVPSFATPTQQLSQPYGKSF